MRINVDFSALWAEVRKISEETATFSLGVASPPRKAIDIQLAEGLEIPLDEVDFSGPVASVQGRQVLLYIPDHGPRFDLAIADGGKGNRFHVTYCRKLEEMYQRKRYDRYVATNDLTPTFEIHGVSNNTAPKGKTTLRVCQFCLDKLNYKGSQLDTRVRAQNAKTFSIPAFFETYSSCFRYMPSGMDALKPGYSNDWEKISRGEKERVNYVCQQCKVDLSAAKRLVHVHHINGVKHDNAPKNLKALCADCHRAEPNHTHMHVSRKDTQFINKLRREQGRAATNWKEALEYADPAVHGVLDLLRAKGWAPPEIGYELQDATGAIFAELEAAWPESKYAITIDTISAGTADGWTIEDLGILHKKAIL